LTIQELQTIFGLYADGIAGNDTIYLLSQLEKDHSLQARRI